ncbi:leucine-rich repeat flightless-interacting protein 2-like isoform X6 [Simochromis diagramma]|uniref:leucine-rich repeat flightless-interacting protein 2-like isoform X6 n=1 Tax=Simochromis diagramma TaxID=43689 RepID=UPI001A7E7714|nr:leucine-rich repeat flightless-interacting protein 2-like isoform X6 [Simochromis diagramma]
MGTQGPGRKRIPNREKLTGEDDALNQIAREAEARLAAKRAARAEAREIRMKELERQKELFHSHKKYYGVDNKWGHIEQWMEDSERYSRHSRRHASISDDEERMSVGSRGSLRPSDYSGFLGSGSRASSRASSARASPVVEDRTDREFPDKGSRTASTLSAATLASLGGASSRRGSCDTSFSVETEASIREMKDSLAETEEKYRKAMVSNAQLHNEKSTLMYQVETLREELNEMEELLWETRRRCDDAHKEWERERHAHSLLQFHFKDMKETLRQTEELLTEVTDLRLKSSSYCQEVSDLQEALQWKDKKIGALERHREISDIVCIERDRLRDEVVRLRDLLKKNGVTISPDITTNGDVELGGNEDDISAESASRLAQESPQGGRENMLEFRLKKLFEERESLQDQVKLLQSQLDQRQKIVTEGVQNTENDGLENGMDSHLLELQRDANRQISDLKFKLVKSEQEVTTLEQNVIRLEGQVSRYKGASENAEKIEDELKVEKRKLQRELRSALDRIDELEASNSHLSKRLEKMKANRNALLAQQ